ncbi:MAG: phosphatidate cytidylyltransferase [Holosporales bacterium]|jgi:phosphatidate cytidylyltransferase|nr:phosphatidate cytidylyltransferase [Holosporales bacterium]
MADSLKLRIIGSVLFGGAILGAIMAGGVYFQLLSAIFLVAMLYEWFVMNRNKKSLLYVLGNVYILIPMLFWICADRERVNSATLFYIFTIVWSCDVFAYFGGKLLKGAKLAPKISPNKTWSGVIVGFVFAFVASYFYMRVFGKEAINFREIILSAVLVLASIFGDLLESKVKRILGVKDSGNIIPGHGGLCDRLDSFLLASYVLAIVKFVGL